MSPEERARIARELRRIASYGRPARVLPDTPWKRSLAFCGIATAILAQVACWIGLIVSLVRAL